jgi:molybdopterin synthase catalytic subunit
MRVRVRLFANYARAAGWRERDIDVPEDSTARGVLEVLRHGPLIALPDVGRPLFAVNQAHVPPDAIVHDGDEVGIFPPVSGGSGAMTFVTDEPLDPGSLAALVRSPEHGAVVVFEGVVRNDGGLAALTYEAYAGMAESVLKDIKAEVERRLPGVVLAMAHRTGRIETGQPSVVVACGSPHRREAFAACRRAMDRIKESLPVWKTQEA